VRFAAPWALAFLVLVPLVFLGGAALRRLRARRLSAAGEAPLFEALTDGGPRLRQARAARTALFAAALGLVALALARPQLGMRTEIRRGRGMDVVIALDLSKSMYARDVVPSRLKRAKVEIGVLLEQLRGDRVGLVGFTSLGLPLCPLTVDHAALRVQLRGAEPSDLPRGGTSVSAALAAGRRMLEAAGHEDADKAVVIITDGEAHRGDPVEAARRAHEEADIVVHTVGVGSLVGEPIPEVDEAGNVTGYVRDSSGETVVSRLDEATLRRIAEAGGGIAALPAGDGGVDLGPVARQLAALRKADLEARTVRVYEERYTWFLAPAFLCLLLATLIRPTRRPGRPQIVLGLLVLLAPRPASAQEVFERTHPEVEAGIEALREGKGEAAREAFARAAQALGDRPEITYDRALADAAAGELDQAMQGFRAAAERAEDANLRARARVGLGNALRKLKKYDEAAAAYREALLEDPSVDAARRNLEITQAMKAIQEAQPKSDEGEEGDGENGDGEDDQDGEREDDQDGDGEKDEDRPSDGAPDAGPADGGGSDAGAEGADAGVGDGGGGGGPRAGDGGSEADAGVPPRSGSAGDAGADAGAPPPEGGGADAGASPPRSGDAGAPDAGAGGAGAAPRDEEPADLSRQEAEAILDALQAEEEALERERLLERFEGRPVEKDW
jgi:Ca-activated chloride channel family protein